MLQKHVKNDIYNKYCLIHNIVTNKENLILSDVGDPLLNQELRYHCPVYGTLKFSKQKHITFTRHIWSYEHGTYNILREKA